MLKISIFKIPFPSLVFTGSWISSHQFSLSNLRMNMWLLAVSVPLLPAIIMLSTRCRHRVSSLYHKALAWARKMVGGKVCVRRTHAFVFTQCTHGKVDSVLETFDLYAAKNPSLAIDQDMGKCILTELNYTNTILYAK